MIVCFPRKCERLAKEKHAVIFFFSFFHAVIFVPFLSHSLWGAPSETTIKGHLFSTLVTEFLWKRTSTNLSSTRGNNVNEATMELKDLYWKVLFANTTYCSKCYSETCIEGIRSVPGHSIEWGNISIH